APAPVTNAPGTSTMSDSGQLSVTGSTTSASGGAKVVGDIAANTGVADLPTYFTVSAPTTIGVTTAPPVNPDSLTGTAPAPITAVVSAATGGVILAGNVAIV